jgi:hypothetical protein
MLKENKTYFHALSDADLATLLSKANALDRELVCLIMAVSEAELMQAASEIGHLEREK